MGLSWVGGSWQPISLSLPCWEKQAVNVKGGSLTSLPGRGQMHPPVFWCFSPGSPHYRWRMDSLWPVGLEVPQMHFPLILKHQLSISNILSPLCYLSSVLSSAGPVLAGRTCFCLLVVTPPHLICFKQRLSLQALNRSSHMWAMWRFECRRRCREMILKICVCFFRSYTLMRSVCVCVCVG